MEFNETGSVVVKKFHARGSIRDMMHSTKQPKSSFWVKYCSGRRTKRNFEATDLRLIGRQVLEGLKFLHSKAIAHGHIHAGNVFITDEGTAQLSELENYLVGLNSTLRSSAVELRAASASLESFDVYCFGHLMFEMATGQVSRDPLETGSDLPDELPDALSECACPLPIFSIFK